MKEYREAWSSTQTVRVLVNSYALHTMRFYQGVGFRVCANERIEKF